MSQTFMKLTYTTWKKKTDATNKLLADKLEANIWFTAKNTENSIGGALVSNAHLLELHEFLPLPIHFNFSGNHSGPRAEQSFGTLLTLQIFSNHLQHHLGDTFFCKGRKVMETSLSLYLANAEAIWRMCKFKDAEASEGNFKLAENSWAVYSTRTINTNQVCQAKNMILTHQIKYSCYI
jgi:hypothetical protein